MVSDTNFYLGAAFQRGISRQRPIRERLRMFLRRPFVQYAPHPFFPIVYLPMPYPRSIINLFLVVMAGSWSLTGCGIGYYWQAMAGHMELMSSARPVADVIADAQVSSEWRQKLIDVGVAVDFAHEQLFLPDNGSYAQFADIGRPYVVWNVVAAPPLSLAPQTWCFPVAGCVSYRGYFSRENALAFADDLSAAGNDVFVGGVAAYSTLGRFTDPLLNTMLSMPDDRLAGLIFHELAHQRLYVRDDTQFNEGFAGFVEAEGLRRWLLNRGDEAAWCRYRLERDRRRQVLDVLESIRVALDSLYAQDIPDTAKLEVKAELLDALNVAYDRLKATWDGPPDFDHWFAAPFTNARFAALATYEDDIPAFAALFAQSGDDLEVFFRRAAELAAEPADVRQARLDTLRAAAIPDLPDLSCDVRTSEFATTGLADRGAIRGSAGSGLPPAH
jgi:predicted aminopeptidase